MRRIAGLLVGLSLCAAAAAPAFGAEAGGPPKPGPEHKRLAYFAGKWNGEAEMKPGPFGPGGKSTSVDDCTWFQGGFQLVCRGSNTSAMGKMKTEGILSYHTGEGTYTYYGFDSTGMGDYAKGVYDNGTWTWSSESKMGGKAFKSRYTIKETSADSYTFKWETSEDGTNWAILMDGKSTRQKKAAAKPAAAK